MWKAVTRGLLAPVADGVQEVSGLEATEMPRKKIRRRRIRKTGVVRVSSLSRG